MGCVVGQLHPTTVSHKAKLVVNVSLHKSTHTVTVQLLSGSLNFRVYYHPRTHGYHTIPFTPTHMQSPAAAVLPVLVEFVA